MADQETEVREDAASPQVTFRAAEGPPPQDPRKGTMITIAGVLVILVVTTALSVLIANIRRVDPGPLDFVAARNLRTFHMVITTTGTDANGIEFELIMDTLVDLERGLVGTTHTYPGEPPVVIRSISTTDHLLFELPKEFRGGLGVDEPWIRAPLTQEAIASFRQGGGILGPPDDPRAFFEQLSSVATEVTEDGTETIRGVQTTRYQILVDVEQFVLNLPGTNEDDATEALKSFESDTMPATIWVGEDGLPYRQSFELTVDEGTFKTVIEYFDYGKPVDIEVPENKDIADAPAGLFGGEETSCTFSETGSTVDGASPQPSPSVSCSPSP